MPSPRDVVEVKEAIDSINHDRLWVKYHPQLEAYHVGRMYFLEHMQYTHLMIIPDDLVVLPEHVETLLSNCENYKVLSGWSNNTSLKTLQLGGNELEADLLPEDAPDVDTTTSMTSLPPNPPSMGTYEGYHFDKIEHMEVLGKMPLLGKGTIHKILHTGFAPTMMTREVVERIPFRGDETSGCCVDSCFSLDLHKEGIEQFVDASVRTFHMNIHPRNIKVGRRPPVVIFHPQS